MDFMERITIPTPFAVGQVNCYFLPGNELCLIDPGPATDDAFEELESSLTHIGYRIEDIDRILVTHPHMDHFGLAGRIVDRSGARVFAHEDAADRLADPVEYFKKEQEYFRPFLRSMGMPNDTVDTVLELPEPYTDYQRSVAVTDHLADGDVLNVGVEFQCMFTPGHAPGSLCFRATSEDAMFTGDHVLPEITPNPLLTLAPSGTERTRSLPTYIDSLRKVCNTKATVGYGGHGKPIKPLDDRVKETITHHQQRKERIAKFVAEKEPTTAYEIMKEMFPDLPATEMFAGMSEVIGHLDLLEDENSVEISQSSGMRLYGLDS